MQAAVTEAEVPPESLNLDQAMAFALEHNFPIRQARERLRQQEGVVTTVTSAALPNLSVTGSFQKSDVPAFQVPSTQNLGVPLIVPSGRYWRMALTARQNLYSGGGIRADIAAANLNLEAAGPPTRAIASFWIRCRRESPELRCGRTKPLTPDPAKREGCDFPQKRQKV